MSKIFVTCYGCGFDNEVDTDEKNVKCYRCKEKLWGEKK